MLKAEPRACACRASALPLTSILSMTLHFRQALGDAAAAAAGPQSTL